jgi:hypothetical protein
MRSLLLTISILMLLPNLLPVTLQADATYNGKELYNPNLHHLTSVQKLTDYADGIAATQKIRGNSLQYAKIVSDVIKNRFYHGFSHYSLRQNWMASIGELVFGHNLAAIVDPDLILQHPSAGCSQQSIVFMEIMSRKGVDYRSILFPHHFASELRFGNDWYYFDPNMEPNIPDSVRKETVWKSSTDVLKQYYNREIYAELDYAFGESNNIRRSAVNATQAPKARIFHVVTGFLSKVLWIAPLILMYYARRKQARNTTVNFTPNASSVILDLQGSASAGTSCMSTAGAQMYSHLR